MKRYLIFLFVTLMAGYGNSQNATNPEDKGLTAREMIEKNTFLDLSEDEMYPKTRSAAISRMANPIFRAACYRFYKAVTIDENGIATCKAQKGADLNMSEALFDDYMSDMENLNEMIREDLEKGIKGKRAPLSDAYFERLLDETQFKITDK